MGFITTDRNQMNLLGFSLDDLVPKNAKCRFIVDIVSQLDLKDLYNFYSTQGNDAFEPSNMLSTWFYAYSDTVTTTRKLEEKCQRDLHYMYVSGNLRPDHTTLSRFRKNHLDLLADYFLQIIKIAINSGVSDFKQIAIDGSKIQASSSAKYAKTADELAQYLDNIRKDIEAYMYQCDLLDDDSDDPTDLDEIRKKIDHLKDLEKTMQDRQEELETRKSRLKPEHRKGHKINISESEARNMNKVNGNQKLPAYNVQVSVDTQTQLIVANETVQDTNDFDQLSRQHQNVEDNLGLDQDRSYVYDAGYHNFEQLEYVYTNHVNAYVASPRKENEANPGTDEKENFDRTDFVYHPETDYYECPAGQKLTYEKDYQKDNKWSGRVYKTEACPTCSHKNNCLLSIKKTKYRRIRREHREIYAEWMEKTGKTDQAKHMQKLRSTSVEPVFGNLKANLGFRRFRLRGLRTVNGEFNLMCIAHNLNKLYVLADNFRLSVQTNFAYLKTLCQRTITQYFAKYFDVGYSF